MRPVDVQVCTDCPDFFPTVKSSKRILKGLQKVMGGAEAFQRVVMRLNGEPWCVHSLFPRVLKTYKGCHNFKQITKFLYILTVILLLHLLPSNIVIPLASMYHWKIQSTARQQKNMDREETMTIKQCLLDSIDEESLEVEICNGLTIIKAKVKQTTLQEWGNFCNFSVC